MTGAEQVSHFVCERDAIIPLHPGVAAVPARAGHFRLSEQFIVRKPDEHDDDVDVAEAPSSGVPHVADVSEHGTAAAAAAAAAPADVLEPSQTGVRVRALVARPFHTRHPQQYAGLRGERPARLRDDGAHGRRGAPPAAAEPGAEMVVERGRDLDGFPGPLAAAGRRAPARRAPALRQSTARPLSRSRSARGQRERARAGASGSAECTSRRLQKRRPHQVAGTCAEQKNENEDGRAACHHDTIRASVYVSYRSFWIFENDLRTWHEFCNGQEVSRAQKQKKMRYITGNEIFITRKIVDDVSTDTVRNK